MHHYPQRFDVIVLGAGHAGVEAALAAARMGAKTLVLTTNCDTIGQMSCNPAIGGLAKGHLAREIDALGGEMALNTEMTGLHFRTLNAAKGPAVRAPRAQCDKKAYQARLKKTVEGQPNLTIFQDRALHLILEGPRVIGVQTAMEVRFLAATVIVTTGTFLQGLMHTGQNKQAGGRAGEGAESGLSGSLREAGLELGRLKTGTPPRLLKKSLNFQGLEAQPGDDPRPAFSFWRNELFHVEQSQTVGAPQEYPPNSILSRMGRQLHCHISYTNEKTAAIIRENLHLSPMYSGEIDSVGPRYCPSIEDKIVRFADKPAHQIFLEPEGIDTDEYYINGFSTCLPYAVQIAALQTIPGCENAEIYRPAYAVEYDFVFPQQLKPSLETQSCAGLFLAGQINGTSGYEEAGAQGLIAGVNAARMASEKEPLILGRDQAYIGVLIDDLVTKGVTEPYRMFTSRAEYRLLLRQDNADLRLAHIGAQVGLLSDERHRRVQIKREQIDEEIKRLQSTREGGVSLEQILRRPAMNYSQLPQSGGSLPADVIQQIEFEIKFAGYISRQIQEVEKAKSMERKKIPDWLDYTQLAGLRNEARQKLSEIRPGTIGQATRISGISPADISLLLVAMRRGPESPESPDI